MSKGRKIKKLRDNKVLDIDELMQKLEYGTGVIAKMARQKCYVVDGPFPSNQLEAMSIPDCYTVVINGK
jgi:hypothetical protein